MAIYDWDGTTRAEIGKVYDWDGTTRNQIGKGYDWDGTTRSQLYSSELVVFDGTSPADYTGGWGISYEYDNRNRYVQLSGEYIRAGKTGGYGPYKAYITVSNNVAIDVTQFKSATIEYQAQVGTQWSIGVGTRGAQNGQLGGTTSVARTTGTIDLTNITGEQYFNLYAYTAGGGIFGWVSVWKIVLE